MDDLDGGKTGGKEVPEAVWELQVRKTAAVETEKWWLKETFRNRIDSIWWELLFFLSELSDFGK